MSREMEDLVDVLKSNPGVVLFNDAGTELYLLVGPEQKLMVATHLSKNFHDMTDSEVEEFIVNLLK